MKSIEVINENLKKLRTFIDQDVLEGDPEDDPVMELRQDRAYAMENALLWVLGDGDTPLNEHTSHEYAERCIGRFQQGKDKR